jgi:hypothetical protein
MTQRRVIAGSILVVWLVALGVLARQELMPNEERRLQLASLLVEPMNYFYAVERDGNHVGYASSQVDTSALGTRLRNAVVIQSGDTTRSDPLDHQYSAQLTTQLRLVQFDITSGRTADKRQLFARAVGDSALELRLERAGEQQARGNVDTVPYSRRAVTPEVAPLLIALGRTLRPGDVHELQIFDRESNAMLYAAVRIEAESLFVVSDSAARDNSTGLFVAARLDSVLAWRVTMPGDGGGVMWFDRGGRIVQQELGLGTTMRRMAFEMAFENWRLTRDTLGGGGPRFY